MENVRQQKCWEILQTIRIFEILKDFNPVLAGTIPIGIDIEGSDLDVICEVYNFDDFQNKVRQHFSQYKKFADKQNENSYVAIFFVDEQEIEIYGAPLASKQQAAYKHMLVENRLLQLFGEDFKSKVVELKKQGYKTEPAFGKLLKLGNPYEELLEMEFLSDSELENKLRMINDE